MSRGPGSVQRGSGGRQSQATISPPPLHDEVQSLLQIDVEVEKPETSENPTQSFEIHYLREAHTAFGRDNTVYRYLCII